MNNFDESYDLFEDDDEEELHDTVEKDNTNINYDAVTKKKDIPQVVRENLYLPGKIMHIRYKKRRTW